MHTCKTNIAKNAIQEVLSKCKQEVTDNFEPVQRIHESHLEELQNTLKEHSDEIPEFKSVRDSLLRSRKMFLECDKLSFNSVSEVHVPEQLGKKS